MKTTKLATARYKPDQLKPTLLPVNSTYVTQICRNNTFMVLDVLLYKELPSPFNKKPIYLYKLQEANNLIGLHTTIIVSINHQYFYKFMYAEMKLMTENQTLA